MSEVIPTNNSEQTPFLPHNGLTKRERETIASRKMMSTPVNVLSRFMQLQSNLRVVAS